MRTSFLTAGLVSTLLAACAPSVASTTVTTSPPTTVTSSVTTSPSTVPVGGCPDGDSFVEDGRVSESSHPGSDAERIGLVSWDTTPQCEAFTIGLVTSEGAPATTPPSVTADFLRQIGVLRIGLAVTATSVTDQLVQSALVDRYYVVRRSDGTLFVDLVLSAPALARVSTSGSPGTVAVELEPGGPPYPATPAVGGLFVVTSPTGESGEAPIPVSGYGRPFEASVVVQVIQDGTVVTEASTHTADYAETWGEFAVEVATPARGPVQLFVGEFSAEDGSPQGVVIPLILP